LQLAFCIDLSIAVKFQTGSQWNFFGAPCKMMLFVYLLTCSVFVQIINDEDPNWFKAEYNGQFGYVPSTYIQYIKPT